MFIKAPLLNLENYFCPFVNTAVIIHSSKVASEKLCDSLLVWRGGGALTSSPTLSSMGNSCGPETRPEAVSLPKLKPFGGPAPYPTYSILVTTQMCIII